MFDRKFLVKFPVRSFHRIILVAEIWVGLDQVYERNTYMTDTLEPFNKLGLLKFKRAPTFYLTIVDGTLYYKNFSDRVPCRGLCVVDDKDKTITTIMILALPD